MLMLAYWPADRSFPVLDITVGDMLREAAAAAPGATALVAGNPGPSDRRRWTYTELLEQSEQAARALLGRFEPGERVAVWANNIPEWVMLEFAAALAGITIVTVNPALRTQELTHVLGQSKANGVFTASGSPAQTLPVVKSLDPAQVRCCTTAGSSTTPG
jgi:acyl-CoA synthetase (AMP-forming)/AMP-acid ligase II